MTPTTSAEARKRSSESRGESSCHAFQAYRITKTGISRMAENFVSSASPKAAPAGSSEKNVLRSR